MGFWSRNPWQPSISNRTRRVVHRRRRGGAAKIGTLKVGSLAKVGYSVTKPTTRRHRAVDRAVKKYGKLSTLRKLNAVRVFTRRTSPAKSRTFKSDVGYVQKKYY